MSGRWIALTASSAGAGLPILIIAFLGSQIHRLVPNICSFTDFTNRRFGMIVQVTCWSHRVRFMRHCACRLHPLACARMWH